MASCFKCEVIDKFGESADPIGVCANCHSLTCADHGTRLRGVPEFKCVFCAPSDLKTAAFRIIHEAYPSPPDGGDRGTRMPGPAGPGPDGGDQAPVPAVASHEEFESSPSTERIAALSADHRCQAIDLLDQLLEKIERFEDAEERKKMVGELAATSDEATQARVGGAGISLAESVRRARKAERFDGNLLADSIGLAAWAIGERAGAEMSVGRILLIPDHEVQVLLRVTSQYLAREVA